MKTRNAHARRLAPALAALAAACACLVAWTPDAARRASAQDDDDDTPASQRRKKEEPRCAVYGRVVYEETNRPVRRARVTLMNSGGNRSDLSALTDSRGDFRIKNVMAGDYYVLIDAPGIMSPISLLSIEDLRARDFEAGGVRKFFEVVEVNGREDKEVTVRARRGAALSGVVKYADGDPAVGVQVHVLRRNGGRLESFLTGINRASLSGLRTDDRGAYRVAGLPPGEYVVAVTEAVEHGDDGSAGARDYYMNAGLFGSLLDNNLLTAFHPSASSRKEAAAVKLDAGDERAGVDVTIPDRQTHTLEGVVRGRRDRRPVPRARLIIARKGEDDAAAGALYAAYGEMLQNSVRADEQGRWRLKEIPDGQYTISVVPPEEYDPSEFPSMNGNVSVSVTNTNYNGSYTAPPRRRKRYAPARQDVQVSGADLTDVAVELSEGARVSGIIVIEGGKPVPEYMQITAVRVTRNYLESAADNFHASPSNTGAFTLEGLSPGKYFLHANPYGSDAGLYLKSATWNGRDALSEPIEVGEGASIEGVRLVYSSDPAKLDVRLVTASEKRPATNVNVFLVPADVSRWNQFAPQSFCSTGDEGVCTIASAPGDYLVVLMPRRLEGGSIEAEIKRRASAAQRVTLRGGETKTFESVVAER